MLPAFDCHAHCSPSSCPITSLPNSRAPCTRWMSVKPRERRSAISGSSNARSATESRKAATASSSKKLLVLSGLERCELLVLLGSERWQVLYRVGVHYKGRHL